MTAPCIGVRREDKNRWERRVPLVPEHVAELMRVSGLRFRLQPSLIRSFSDAEFARAGAEVDEDLAACPVILAVKEIPESFFLPGRTYLFFSHTIKGQPKNMPMLRRMMDLGCQLIEYEKIVDGNGRRLIFFGRYAGIAGMLDTLWALGRRLLWEGIPSPFAGLQPAHRYGSLDAVRAAVAEAGEEIRLEGLPASLAPLVFGFAGYGHVSRGAQEILGLLPLHVVTPAELLGGCLGEWTGRNEVFKVEFREEDLVLPRDPARPFELQDYYHRPEGYRSRFAEYLPWLTVLINGIYWESRYPRLVTREQVAEMFAGDGAPRLRVIGDISCDVEGAIECTLRNTDPGSPVYVYDPRTGRPVDGVEGRGLVIMAVDNLPCELPSDSSREFSAALRQLVPAIAAADFSLPFERLDLPPEVRRAVVLHQGRLTPDYRYLESHLAG